MKTLCGGVLGCAAANTCLGLSSGTTSDDTHQVTLPALCGFFNIDNLHHNMTLQIRGSAMPTRHLHQPIVVSSSDLHPKETWNRERFVLFQKQHSRALPRRQCDSRLLETVDLLHTEFSSPCPGFALVVPCFQEQSGTRVSR
jgi:hypothetical protein